MKRTIRVFLALLISLPLISGAGSVKIKDVATVAPNMTMEIVGYGVIGGLDGKGDSGRVMFTNQSIANMLKKLQITVDGRQISTRNIAGVIVSAEVPSYLVEGTQIDVTVISIGDARSLEGGYLIQTPLLSPAGDIIAVAQGSLLSTGRDPKSGRIPNGAVIKQTYIPEIVRGYTKLALRYPDYTTAQNISSAINSHFASDIAVPVNRGIITVQVPENLNFVEFISRVENLAVNTQSPAKVVIDQRTGTVVIGQDVFISPVVISHKNVKIAVGEKNVREPEQQAEGSGTPEVGLMPSATVKELAFALNKIGITPDDMVSIFQALKTCGALQAELEVH